MLLLIFNKHTEVLKGKNNTHYNTDSNICYYLYNENKIEIYMV